MSIYTECGIYRITNKINGCSYIGKTAVSFGDRWDCHKARLNGGYHDNPHLQRSWNKYGSHNFEFEVLEVVSDITNIDSLEISYIKAYREIGKCYNILDGGDGGFMLGSHLSEDAKKRISEKNKINMTGRKASQETRARMSASQKRRYLQWTEADRIAHGKISAERASGYKWSDESKKKFSEKQHFSPNGAKYTVETVKEIRRLYEIEDKTFSEISYILNIPRGTIYNIATYRRWANIT